jgi:glutamate--cysteine ligase
MPDNISSPTHTIKQKSQMVGWLASQAKEQSLWRIGTEHEKFLFHKADNRPVGYEGERGIQTILKRLQAEYQMTPIMEKGHIIGLKDNQGGSITLEPGGQLELSGAPLENLHQTCKETGAHLNQMKHVISDLEIGMLGLGFQPIWGRDDISWMPKGRYKIMREYMPKRGNLGIDMMLRSCTVQVNLDYADERDMVRKFRTSLALQPVATALFANSPFKDGKLSGLKSTRAHVWTDTDPDRCGVPEIVFDSGFGYEAWIDYILDVPMYFLHRGDDYLDVSGLSFAEFMAGRLAGFEGQYPLLHDFEDHITTAFPEVRLKGYLEMRGADSGSWNNICALPALWVGTLYDDEALARAEALVADIGAQDVENARHSAAKDGLAGKFGEHMMLDIAQKFVDIASDGLKARNRLDDSGMDERGFLSPLKSILKSRKTNADLMIEAFKGEWQGDINKVFVNHDF